MKRFSISILAFMLVFALCAGMCAASADGAAPVAENLELKTYQNVSVGGSLSAYDPDGGALEYAITTQPVKGSIELKDDGSFVYTPRENKKGRDYFGYKAADGDGNLSQEATVIIRIEKAKKDVLYSDMRGRPDEYSAMLLSEKGIFTGAQIGGKYCFCPDKTVSRGEFLSMCMLAAGEPVVDAALSTGYADDDAIPAWMKCYVATADMCGVVAAQEAQTFSPDEPITKAEAALMLDRAINITTVSYMPLDDSFDAEVAQACVNLSAVGAMDAPAAGDYLTRADMARMLSAAIAVLEKR